MDRQVHPDAVAGSPPPSVRAIGLRRRPVASRAPSSDLAALTARLDALEREVALLRGAATAPLAAHVEGPSIVEPRSLVEAAALPVSAGPEPAGPLPPPADQLVTAAPVAAAEPPLMPRASDGWIAARASGGSLEGTGMEPVEEAWAVSAAASEAATADEPVWDTGVTYEPEPERYKLPSLSSISTGRLLAVAGGVALVLGAVFFLSLAFTRGWITEEARVILGLAGGLVLLGLGPVTFDRRQPTLAHVLVAVGICVLELSLYAARLYALAPVEAVLAGALVVAALATAIAVRFDSQVVAALGLLAVLAAPPLMGAPASLSTVAFLAIVLVAASGVSVARGWRWLPWLSLAVTYPQLLTWLWSGEEPEAIVFAALTGYWIVLAGTAAAEAWRRPPTSLYGSAAALLVTTTTGVAIQGVLWLSWEATLGPWLLVLAGLHLALGAWFLVRRARADDHGQLLVAMATLVSVPGIALTLPDTLIPVALAAEAAVLAGFDVRFRHWYALAGTFVLTLLVGGFVAVNVYPLEQVLDAFPPVGLGLMETADAAIVVAGILAVLGVSAIRWLTSNAARSVLAALAMTILAYAAPYEIGGLGLLVTWEILALVAMVLASVAFVSLQRGAAPVDALFLAGASLAGLAFAWSALGFAAPQGSVEPVAELFVERALAGLVPVIGLIAMVLVTRDRWWRGLFSAGALLCATVSTWLLLGAAQVSLRWPVTAEIDGAMLVLMAWSTLGIVALVLDERPRLRLASEADLASDPLGHPLALAAAVPAALLVLLLGVRFLSPGVGAALPETPFTDARTVATAIVVGTLLLGARLARTRFVNHVLSAIAVVLVAALLPLEMPLEWAVAGWAALAVVVMTVSRTMAGLELAGGVLLAAGLIGAGVIAVLVEIAPIDRLFLEATSVPPLSGPPNEATLALIAICVASAAGAVLLVPLGALRRWFWVVAGVAVTYLLSVAIADTFAMRVAGGASLDETAKQAQVAISILWATLGFGTLVAGLVLDRALARQAGLVLLAVATVKVFAYDLAALDVAYRVLSLIGLGVLLLLGAWAYQHARHRGGPAQMSR